MIRDLDPKPLGPPLSAAPFPQLSRADRARMRAVQRRILKTRARIAAAEADAAQPRGGFRCTCHRLYSSAADRAACKARQHREIVVRYRPPQEA